VPGAKVPGAGQVRPENGDTHLYGKLLNHKGEKYAAVNPGAGRAACHSAKVPTFQGAGAAKVPKCRPKNGDTHLYGKLLNHKARKIWCGELLVPEGQGAQRAEVRNGVAGRVPATLNRADGRQHSIPALFSTHTVQRLSVKVSVPIFGEKVATDPFSACPRRSTSPLPSEIMLTFCT
jgi:hypothetical protein